MSDTVTIRKTPSIFDEIKDVQNRIMRRAHEIFERNGGALGRELEDWLEAERELAWKPSIELSETGDAFQLKIAVPGIEAKDIDLEVTPEDILVRAEVSSKREADRGEVHVSELETGSMFRAVRLPKKIDPNKVRAECRNGLLTLTAPIASEVPIRKVAIERAS